TPAVGSLSVMAVDVTTGASQGAGLGDVAPYQVDVAASGAQIAFGRTDPSGHPQIFIASTDGTNATQVTGLPGQPGCDCGARDPDWSPDGTRIAFSGDDLNLNKDIYVLTVGSGAIHRVTRGFGGQASPAWSPDGTILAYESGNFAACGCGTTTTGSIWLVDISSSRRTRL